MNDELYYVLDAPGGQSTLFAVGSTGEELGYILYDATGSVVTSTLPATLTNRLVSHLDPAGLQYDGTGYYDPWAGIYVQPSPFGGVPEAPQSPNRFVPDTNELASTSASSGRTSYRRAMVTMFELGFSMEVQWWMQQGVGQGVTYGLTEHLAEYSLIRFTVSASRHKLLTRLPQEAIELLGGQSLIKGLPANRGIHTLSTGGLRAIRGQVLSRSVFDDFTRFSADNPISTKYAGRLGDDFFGHSFSWMGSRWFGATLAGAGDLGIQWFWPGTGDFWNYQEYGLTPGQFIGRGAVAAGGGLLAWGAVELTTAALVAGGVIAAPAEMPILAGIGIFLLVEYGYEKYAKEPLYEWFGLYGSNEPQP